MLFEPTEHTEPSRSGNKDCLIFQWIGQSFESCDGCGKPYWEHLYDPAYGGSKGEFRVKVYVKYADKWEWRRVTVITPDKREATREKWEGYLKYARTPAGSARLRR
jgi:hypothetical protein